MEFVAAVAGERNVADHEIWKNGKHLRRIFFSLPLLAAPRNGPAIEMI